MWKQKLFKNFITWNGQSFYCKERVLTNSPKLKKILLDKLIYSISLNLEYKKRDLILFYSHFSAVLKLRKRKNTIQKDKNTECFLRGKKKVKNNKSKTKFFFENFLWTISLFDWLQLCLIQSRSRNNHHMIQ